MESSLSDILGSTEIHTQIMSYILRDDNVKFHVHPVRSNLGIVLLRTHPNTSEAQVGLCR